MSNQSYLLTLVVAFVVVQILLWIKSHREESLLLLRGNEGRVKLEQIVPNKQQASLLQNNVPVVGSISKNSITKEYEDIQNNNNVFEDIQNNNNVFEDISAKKNVKSVEISKPMSWLEFTSLSNDRYVHIADEKIKPINDKFAPILCSANITSMLNKKMVTIEDVKWCQWAVSSSGGNVVVGSSWGSLTKTEDRLKFDLLNCNAVSKDMNPTCNDKWGDQLIKFWRKKRINRSCKGKSKIYCNENVNNDRFCIIEDVQINFKLMRNDTKPGIRSFSRLFEKGFIATDCDDALPLYKQFNELHSSKLVSNQCDHTLMGNTVIFSHDRIDNAGHFMQDVMNVWVLLWVTNLARYSKEMTFLNIDAILNAFFSFNDEPNHLFDLYYHNFLNVIKGSSYGDKTVCIKRVIFQTLQPVLFVRDGWNADQTCSLIGPSSLYQRYNIHMRNSYNLLNIRTNKFKIVFIVRKETKNLWGTMRTSRILLNELKLVDTLKAELNRHEFGTEVEFAAVDLSSLSIKEQIKLFSSTNIIIGLHGAGIVMSSMHLPIGIKNCCGVLEIYPNGEFTPIRGHGNMIREMGIHYDRLDLTAGESSSNGVTIHAEPLLNKLLQLIDVTIEKPTCILPEVYNNPYFE
jgi:hypothetical protein